MRDLAARLRAIVKQDAGTRPELTYVPDTGGATLDVDAVTAALGGARFESGNSACIVIDHVWDADRWHGRRRVASYAIDSAAPIGLFDGRFGASDEWASRIVFFDIETTGLSGGAGTLAFLAGCGWFEDGAFKVRQFLLSGPAGEQAMLDALAAIFEDTSLLVTFNGRSFDVPFMEMRWAFHRRESPASDLPHFDMLPPARRLWKRLADPARTAADPSLEDRDRSCTLTSLERSVLRFHRIGDVPGFEIPSKYFQFLRTGDPRLVEGVLEHNRHDLLSLAAVMSHALRLASEGPEVCETPTEQVALGRLYNERAGDSGRATQAYGLAAASEDGEVAAHALARLAVLLRREQRHEEAAAAWQGVLTLASQIRRPLSALERRATEALAIHHEHRARDLGAARQYAETLREHASGRLAGDVDHRLGRLDRKIRAAENEKGGPQAARLID